MPTTYLLALLPLVLLPTSLAQQPGNFPQTIHHLPILHHPLPTHNPLPQLALHTSSLHPHLLLFLPSGGGWFCREEHYVASDIDQVQYLLGRDLSWNPQNLLLDNEEGEYVMYGTTGGALTCSDAVTSLLPSVTQLPNPYTISADDDAWYTAITLNTSSSDDLISSSVSASASESTALSETRTDVSSNTSVSSSETSAALSSTASTSESSATSEGSGFTTAEQDETTVQPTQNSLSSDAVSTTSSDILGVKALSSSVTSSPSSTSSSSPSVTSSDSASTDTAATSSQSVTSSFSSSSSAQEAAATTAPKSTSTSASSDNEGSCVPVTITQVQIVTVGAGSERR
ncbi:hypothetical protein IAR50_007457 [Cryptococcus sp. DSM 104548]